MMAESDGARIVAIAIDESEHSENAFQWYCDHIYMFGDYLLLIHIPESYDFTMASPAVVEQLLKELEERVDNLEKKYRDKLLSKRISGKFRTASGNQVRRSSALQRKKRHDLLSPVLEDLARFEELSWEVSAITSFITPMYQYLYVDGRHTKNIISELLYLVKDRQ
uniref:UspA domain-containing protein n=1 Tax=Arion vulgaris TaxID=1028688 RepID=A0A0B6ZLZ0_9EUPU